jgi:ABC-type transporter Mla subunit MlaD
MPGRPKRRSAADTLRDQIGELEQRLAHLEQLLDTVRAEASRSTPAAQARLARIEKMLASRIATTQETLRSSLDRVGRIVAESRKAVEAEIGRLTRGFRAGVEAGRQAYRKKDGD